VPTTYIIIAAKRANRVSGLAGGYSGGINWGDGSGNVATFEAGSTRYTRFC